MNQLVSFIRSALNKLVYVLLALPLRTSTTPIYQATGDPKHRKPTGLPQPTVKFDGIALCYARKSVTQGEHDTLSIERQIENMRAVAAEKGLTVELYIDAEGHRSGREEANRPEWLKLKARIGQPGVVALLLNDLSRAHRKGWRVGQLIELLDKAGMSLILAGLDRSVDLTSVTGRLFVSIIAMVDEWYSEDISARQRDRYASLRRKGLNAGAPPYGVIRGEGGRFVASPFGVWLLADGRWVSGREDDDPPETGAIWRGYYGCARQVLEWYSQNDIGTDGLMYRLRAHGWAFRTISGQPAWFRSDDVRRVIASWPKYANIVVVGRLKDRKANDIPLDWPDSGHAVFPLPLLRRVAQVEQERRKSRAVGSVRAAHPFALRGLVRCAQCAQASADAGETLPVPHLTGTDKNGKTTEPSPNRRVYIHASGEVCACRQRSVREPVLNHDVREWLAGFRFDEPAAAILMEQGMLLTALEVSHYEEREAQRRAALRSCHRRLIALDNRYTAGNLEHPETYDGDRARLISEEQRLKRLKIPKEADAVSMSAYLSHVVRPVLLWNIASPEQRQALIASLLVRLDYDLDQQGTPTAIKEYVLQPWANYLLKRD